MLRRKLADYDRAISPKDAVAYYQRAVLKLYKLDKCCR
jgi:hypothetical protein